MRLATTLFLACCVIFLAAGTASANSRMLVVGDSLSIPLGQQLEKFYSLRKDVTFHSHGKVSSGLARPEFYNWERTLDKLAATQRPDTLVVMLGTNDFNSLSNGAQFGTAAWDSEYSRRVQKLVDIARSYNSNVRIYWVGAPVMGRADLDKGVRHINSVIKQQMARNSGCTYIDTRNALSDAKGAFITFASTENGRVRLRADDGVHVTSTGASLLADSCLQVLGAPAKAAPVLAAAEKAPRAVSASSRTPQAPVRTVAYTPVSTYSKMQASASKPYAIQESSWQNAAQAKQRAGQLATRGIAAWVKSVNLGHKGTWHRVMIGSYASLAAAKRDKLQLARNYALANTLIIRVS